MGISAGELRHRITIGNTMSATDADGYAVPADEIVCNCWAAVQDGSFSANEYFQAASGNVRETVAFTVRYGVVAQYRIKPGMWLDYRGVRHDILQLYDANHRRDYVKLNASRREAMSG